MKKYILASAFLTMTLFGFSQSDATIHHVLNVQINPETSEIVVIDTVFNVAVEELVFSLNASLTPTSFSKHVKAEQLDSEVEASDVGMDRDDSGGNNNGLKLNKWKLNIKKGSEFFVINYEGKIDSPIEQSEENYQRGFSESPGIINDLGIYLAGSTYWVPTVESALMTFKLSTTLPADWKTVTQGERIAESTVNDKHLDTWLSQSPQEEVFLIAARFNEYSHSMNSGIEAMAFLRTPDEGIANKYLEVTEQYMNMYLGLIGPYPYSKFALVENFWETGYGMPSFTLLGEKIIRFPFILHSSYPHELLHNWWGNGVYVDFDSGNWCEGLTAYMADHLIKEQRGDGDSYRRSTLQKYTNVVDESNDFPTNQFLSRHDAPSSSIGYGKVLMMFHMLRQKLGDEDFKKTIGLFYANNEFKVASYADIKASAEEVSEMDLNPFFTQWTTRTGAPEIGIKEVKVSPYNKQFRVFLTLEQKQSYDAFDVDVPVAIATEKGVETFVVNLTEKSQDFQLNLSDKPLKLAIDPQYDVFRILHPMEVPPAWSKILASNETLVVLPAAASEDKKKFYQDFTDQWIEADNDNYKIVFDDEIEVLPKDQASLIIGFENRFVENVNKAVKDYNTAIRSDSVMYESKMITTENNSFILTFFDENNVNNSHAFIAINNAAAIPGLVRKLPHYGKYSYLGFEGDEPVNIAKGQWPVLNSPMIKVFDESAQAANMNQDREALATLAPVFSENKMMNHIEFLASKS